MERKKSKYDTNPLDHEVARAADDLWGAEAARGTAPTDASDTEDMSGATGETGRSPQTEARSSPAAEAPTRRYDNPNLSTSYPSVFATSAYQPPAAQERPGVEGGAFLGSQAEPYTAAGSFHSPPTSRPVRGVNLPENVLMIMPYLPFPVVGAVVGAVELFLVPRDEPRTRFHAAQGLALHLIALAVSILTSTADNFLRGPAMVMLTIASAIFSIAAFVFFIICMIRVWKGEPHVVGAVAELTRWLNEKIEPRANKG